MLFDLVTMEDLHFLRNVKSGSFLKIPFNSPLGGWGDGEIVASDALEQPIDLYPQRYMFYKFSNESDLEVYVKADRITPQDIDATTLFARHYMERKAVLRYTHPELLKLTLPDVNPKYRSVNVYELIGKCYDTIKRSGLRYSPILSTLYAGRSFTQTIDTVDEAIDKGTELGIDEDINWELAPAISNPIDVV